MCPFKIQNSFLKISEQNSMVNIYQLQGGSKLSVTPMGNKWYA